MIYIINDNSVVIVVNNHRVELSKINFSKDILNEDILNDLSISDLLLIWNNLYGIPTNIKAIIKKKIELHSSSSSINSFIYKENEYWLDKTHRTTLKNLSESSLGNIEFVVGDEIVELSPIQLKSFLVKLETYAYKCFVNTFKHMKNLDNLSKTEDILNYDYTSGYPEKVVLE